MAAWCLDGGISQALLVAQGSGLGVHRRLGEGFREGVASGGVWNQMVLGVQVEERVRSQAGRARELCLIAVCLVWHGWAVKGQLRR